jgi:hypothetical protein
MSLSGQTLRGILPMLHPKMSKSCLDLLTIQLKSSKVLKNSYGLASMHRICHGRNKEISITYAYISNSIIYAKITAFISKILSIKNTYPYPLT